MSIGVKAIAVCVVVGAAAAVGVESVVPDLRGGGVDGGEAVVAVGAPMSIGVEAVAVSVVVGAAAAVCVESVVPVLSGVRVHVCRRVVAVCGIGDQLGCQPTDLHRSLGIAEAVAVGIGVAGDGVGGIGVCIVDQTIAVIVDSVVHFRGAWMDIGRAVVAVVLGTVAVSVFVDLPRGGRDVCLRALLRGLFAAGHQRPHTEDGSNRRHGLSRASGTAGRGHQSAS